MREKLVLFSFHRNQFFFATGYVFFFLSHGINKPQVLTTRSGLEKRAISNFFLIFASSFFRNFVITSIGKGDEKGFGLFFLKSASGLYQRRVPISGRGREKLNQMQNWFFLMRRERSEFFADRTPDGTFLLFFFLKFSQMKDF